MTSLSGPIFYRPSRYLPPPRQWSALSPLLPSVSGVYWFLGPSKQVLYVGKANHLKRRLSSYTLSKALLPRTRSLVDHARHTRFISTPNELTALITEAHLIRKHQPPYNVLLKDERSPLYIVLTKETYPKVILDRKANLSRYSGAQIFGPFSSSRQTRHLLDVIRQLFPFCNASRKSRRACMYYHLHLCPGVCCGHVGPAAYRQTIRRISAFLNTDYQRLISTLTKQINWHSRLLEFETASSIKNKLTSLNYWLALKQSSHAIDQIPNLIDDLNYQRLSTLKQLMSKYLNLPSDYDLSRIEGYDISNLGGKMATASMVVFNHGISDKSEYRHFRIHTLNTPNDTGMLSQALNRRFQHPEWPLPNLILIDGGKAQLFSAKHSIPPSIPVVSIAKHPDRLLILSDHNHSSITYIPLKPQAPEAQLLLQVRDEAHRFAKNYHSLLHVRNYR